ncbi:hypothetical protein [Amycolatopsis taiwanensis]|uniref:hypothetical protein n=1 Tax=Amycolatopsis taiwanensis TaxID=342230 RepID=UPI0004B61333|nr:hypothetical protein [Amycolatopsis taiwanensis]
MSKTFSPRAWAIFLLVVAADVLDLLSTTVTNVAAACAMSIPLLPRRGAHLH